MTDAGYGMMEPGDVSHPFNAASFHIWQVLSRVRTGTVVKVIAVHVEDGVSPVGTVDVQPLVQMVNGNLVATSHGTIFGLPYFRMQGGDNAIIIDPAPDDIGLAQISDRDISNVKSAKAEAPPGSQRKFDLADGIYLGGILNGAPTQYLRFTADGMSWVDAFGNTIVSSSAGVDLTPATGMPVTTHGNLVVSGSLQVEGGAVFTRFIKADFVTSFGGTVGGGATVTVTQSVPGVKVGDWVIISSNPVSTNIIVFVVGYVRANDVVTLVAANANSVAQPMASTTYHLLVIGSS